MPYHIIKQSRAYLGQGYSGPSCLRAGVVPGRTYALAEIQEALEDMNKLEQVNPVGWQLINTDTGLVALFGPNSLPPVDLHGM